MFIIYSAIMKITLNISDIVMKRLKEESTRSGKTMSELIETALRIMLSHEKTQKKILELPLFDGGEFLVDISNRDYLYDVMDKI
ncbi:MAG: hypothetical protein A2161_14835 [Candidatus Schekmanbacteria bacterium RBG_13_48_7]|uniref:Ribbon-helix-helix protein CopG domain-containing protein n=1 Tax=Candidatus Schekmanbacteria bacterium RBG_13_48_7 TaxID=1817878 RepID=A0A1F7RXX2_9BACT|nr:MAG: hypothetical protein A2161_14835 [Candidatus Schekmanbacteria bacterium RBG_13_48_7]